MRSQSLSSSSSSTGSHKPQVSRQKISSKLNKQYEELAALDEKIQSNVHNMVDPRPHMRHQVLKMLANLFRKQAQPPYMPEAIAQRIRPVVDEWIRWVEEQVSAELDEETAAEGKEYREMRTHLWAVEYHIFTWARVRAKILHSIYPADGNVWSTLQDPLSATILFLKIFPYTSVLMFMLTFALIDRSDEYQLVAFILKFKSFQFFTSGLVVGTWMALKSFHCLSLEEAAYGSACLRESPGASWLNVYYRLPLEPIRIGLLHYACYLLWSGQAYGGQAELAAIEDARLDAADPYTVRIKLAASDADIEANLFAAKVDRHRLRAFRFMRMDYFATDYATDAHRKKHIELTVGEMHALVKLHRKVRGTQIRYGRHLPRLMRWDAYVVLAIFLLFVILLPWSGGFLNMHTPMFWTSLYYGRFVYALLAFPFLIFNVPVVGQALHGAKLTAYDRAGCLCPQLSTALLRKKIAADKKREKTVVRMKARVEDVARSRGGGVLHAAHLIQRQARRRAFRNQVLADAATTGTCGLVHRNDMGRYVGSFMNRCDCISDHLDSSRLKIVRKVSCAFSRHSDDDAPLEKVDLSDVDQRAFRVGETGDLAADLRKLHQNQLKLVRAQEDEKRKAAVKAKAEERHAANRASHSCSGNACSASSQASARTSELSSSHSQHDARAPILPSVLRLPGLPSRASRLSECTTSPVGSPQRMACIDEGASGASTGTAGSSHASTASKPALKDLI